MAIEDFLHPWKNLYRIAPSPVKRTLGQFYAALPMWVRYGKLLAQTRRLLDQSQGWSWEQHREYQWSLMSALLDHCLTNVPYYRKVAADLGIDRRQINSQDDWHRLPLLTKDMVRSLGMELVAENMRNKMLSSNTGGSTGQPLQLYWERGRTRSLERAFMWRQWAWGGFRYGQRTVVMRGQTVNEPLWHYDPIDKHLFVNSYNLTLDSAARIIRKLRQFRPVSIQAYPSIATTFAMMLNELGEPPIPSVKVLLCGSENLYPEQKRMLAEVLKARVYSWYGHGESCCLAGYCDQADYYHVYSEYGYTELVGPQGNVLPWTPGTRGEIVATSLIDDTMPLIRYRTGDIAVVGPEKCVCGRNYRLIERIEGRKQEYVVTADGRTISLTGLVFGQHWHAFSHIRKVQLVQEQAGRVCVRVVPTAEWNEHDEAEIRTKMNQCARGGLETTFELVDEIAPTSRGKHIFLVQKLTLPSAWAGEVADSQS
ncbi:MAG: phenylacetate--CoA ligase family protein [Phycisphaerae bacterium]|nr:phenylacetate--CoA ligase family protein [Phycisphaerae bacterium]